MKRGIALLLTLVLALTVLAVPAMAAETTTPVVYNLEVKSGYTVSMRTESGAVATAYTGIVEDYTGTVYENAAKLTLTFSGQAGKQYMVFLLKGAEVPTEGSIQYINQAAGDGTVNFEIYPKDLTAAGEYRLYVSGTDLDYTEVATFSVTKSWEKAPYILGDVNESGNVTAADAALVLQYAVNSVSLTETQLAAARVNDGGLITASNASLILQYSVGSITKFPVEQ